MINSSGLMSGSVVDLTLTLAPELPGSWPGALPFRHFVEHWFEHDDDGVNVKLCGNNAPYRSHGMIIDEHTGTHFDAPSHFLAPVDSELPMAHPLGNITGDQVPPEQFMGTAAVIDARDIPQPPESGYSPLVLPQHVLDWEDSHQPLRPGDVVLFRSGWDSRYQAGTDGLEYIQRPMILGGQDAWPAPTAETMTLLADRGVLCVGTDGASMGPAQDGAPTHVSGLSRGLVFVECLTNLGQLPEYGAQFIFLPLKVARSAGGPGRAIALLPSAQQ